MKDINIQEKNTQEKDTQEKIKDAARGLFMQKGYEATSIREIAGVAEVNLALVNYYFTSKENLFMEIMREKVQALFGDVVPVIMDESISLEEKLDDMVDRYITVIDVDQNIPIFIFSELYKQDNKFMKLIPVSDIISSSMLKQLQERQPDTNPIQHVLNILSLAFFPYIIGPIMVRAGVMNDAEMRRIMKERITLIPQWIKLMINSAQ